ncbi:MAG: thiolase family protein [Desulfurococcales archaeon]|nr:thiolase family protein [Desulfurococcales archaeon]MCE4604917.1 thiolase family protein [Desulfurococcales archaeon]
MAWISGVGMVRINRHYQKGLRDLAVEAASQALRDAGVDGIDYVVVASSSSYRQVGQLDLASYTSSYLGLRGARSLAVEAGEASGLAGLLTAYSLVASGAAETVLLVGVDKLTEYNSGEAYDMIEGLYDVEGEGFYNIGHAGVAGLLMRLYMHEYGVDRLTMSYWPAVMHANAKQNPYAMLRFAVTPEKVASAMPLADPVTLLDSYPLGDGAAAVVVTRRPGQVRIVGVETATGLPSPAHRDDPLYLESVAEAVSRLGLSREDLEGIDVMEIHDSFTITAYMILETLGLSDKGRAAKDLAEGKYTVEGDGPVMNPSGGLKARGHPIGATGVYQLAEVTMYLRGDFPGVKTNGARRGMVISMNAMGSSAYTALLQAE